MKTIDKVGAQGDVLLVRIDTIPASATQRPAQGNRHVLARGDSASGEHFVSAVGVTYLTGGDDRTAYLRVDAEHADITHSRPTDTHDTLRLGAGSWMVRRQREHTPDGFRRVED